jgi:hypothetical protein
VEVKLVCRATLFWVKYLDFFQVRAPGARDVAGGTLFISRRVEEPVDQGS